MFPLFPFEVISVGANLIIAFFVGLSFGVILEQAGLGNPKKLVGQFLLHDMTVLKVMFSAIVTCMTSLFYLHYLGLLELSLLMTSDVAVWPQLIGGLILGAGFMLSGYCPGTALVGVSSGHKDAIAAVAGLFVGSLLFGLMFDRLADFYHDTSSTQTRLPELLNVSYGTLVLLIILMAMLCFWAAEVVERHKRSHQ